MSRYAAMCGSCSSYDEKQPQAQERRQCEMDETMSCTHKE
jgi:hypothetical protein